MQTLQGLSYLLPGNGITTPNLVALNSNDVLFLMILWIRHFCSPWRSLIYSCGGIQPDAGGGRPLHAVSHSPLSPAAEPRLPYSIVAGANKEGSTRTSPNVEKLIKPAGINANHSEYNFLYLEVALIKSADMKPVRCNVFPSR